MGGGYGALGLLGALGGSGAATAGHHNVRVSAPSNVMVLTACWWVQEVETMVVSNYLWSYYTVGGLGWANNHVSLG